jgi:hypothetical protein
VLGVPTVHAQIPGGAFTTAAAGPASRDDGASITTGADGLGLIGYVDGLDGYALKVAHCENPACSSTSVTTLAPVAHELSLTMGADGLPVLAYGDGFDVWVAHCADPACTTSSSHRIGDGFDPSITIGADGLPLLAYGLPNRLVVAHCADATCSTAATTTLVSGTSSGADGIAIGGDGRGLILYVGQGGLSIAHCIDLPCSDATSAVIEDHVFSLGNSIAVGADGRALVSYHKLQGGLFKVAHCEDALCSTVTVTVLDSGGLEFGYTWTAVGRDGLGLIAYEPFFDGPLKVAHCSNPACTLATRTILDSAGSTTTSHVSATVTLGGDGQALIAYVSGPDGQTFLKTAHQAPRGDFNTDGRQDLVWRRDVSGDNLVWFMNGANLLNASFTNPATLADPGWRMVGTNDFNNDAQTDLLWRHSTSGQNVVWFMSGVNLIGGELTTPSALADTRWQMVGTGDFDRDGRPDILWRHDFSGENVLWYMNGTVLTTGTFLTPSALPDVRWKMAGVADFNGDGKPDILWHHSSSGEVVLWYMDGSVLTGGTFTSPSALPDTRWHIAAVGDYNADDRPDLVWHNDFSGQTVVWFMDNATLVNGTFTNPSTFPDTNWKLVGPR